MENQKSDPIVIEKTFKAPANKVWEAITDKDKMKLWYFDLKEFKPVPGFEFQFEGGPDEKKYIHVCKITEAIPGKKLVYSWTYAGYSGISYVGFELVAAGEGTKVILTHSGLESFEINKNPHLDKKNFEAGWSDIIGRSLKEYMEKIR